MPLIMHLLVPSDPAYLYAISRVILFAPGFCGVRFVGDTHWIANFQPLLSGPDMVEFEAGKPLKSTCWQNSVVNGLFASFLTGIRCSFALQHATPHLTSQYVLCACIAFLKTHPLVVVPHTLQIVRNIHHIPPPAFIANPEAVG